MIYKVFAILLSLGTLGLGANVVRMTADDLEGVQQDVKVKVEADLCPVCVSFAYQVEDKLLNIILNTSANTCGAICSVLANETGSTVIGATCNVLCDIEGVREFTKLVRKADLDPIYLCELLKRCPVFDKGDAKFTNATVTPASAPPGTPREIAINWSSKNGTGSGQLVVEIDWTDHILTSVSFPFFLTAKPGGSYNKTMTLNTVADPNCNPNLGYCMKWLPGNYSVELEICNGQCSAFRPHTKGYDVAEAFFVIEEK